MDSFLNVDFTDTDRAILNAYFNLADAVADIIGPHCEVVIHSLENIECSLIKIIHGHHTGRTLGSPITDMGLKILRQYQRTGKASLNHYFGHNKQGALIKSTTCILTRHASREPIGLFCINMNLSTPFPEVIKTFLPDYSQHHNSIGFNLENFGSDAQEIIEHTLKQAITEVWNDNTISLSHKNSTIIHLFYESGIFEFKEATTLVAERLGISHQAVNEFIQAYKITITL